MKTPRELLLNRHREAEPALAEVRENVLRDLSTRNAREAVEVASANGSFFYTLWQELFVACRGYWMGLGLAWCVIVLFSITGRTNDSTHAVAAVEPSGPVLQAVREQQRLRDELLGIAVLQEARAVPRDPVLGPRSEVTVDFVNV